MRTQRIAAATAAVALVLGWQPVASGYAIEVHKDFYDLAFGGREAGRQVSPPSQAALEAFRRFVWERGSQNPEFRRRWPTADAFDAAALKELLALNPGKHVVGIDRVPGDRPTDVRTIVREGSVDPDNDDRNQDRLFVRDGAVVLDAFGRAVPDDPRTTWFGGLTGTASQFDAHGATLRTGEKGGGVWTALRRPEHFARPPAPMGSAPEFSDMYTQLAMAAHLWGGEGSEWLALTFGGNNMHGIEDLGNQIHTTVIGSPKFFIDAKYTYYAMRLRRMFKKREDPAAAGFTAPERLTPEQVNAAMALIKVGREDEVDPRVRFALGKEPQGQPSDVDLGMQIISNHHLLLEDFVESQYLAGQAAIRAGRPHDALPEVRRLIRRAQIGDEAFERRCRAALRAAGLGTKDKGLTPFSRILCELMIEHSAPEAQPYYEAIRAISKRELKREGIYDHKLGHQPLDFVTETQGEHTDEIWELSSRAFARVVTALRLWEETFQAEVAGVTPGSPEALERAGAVVDRLVATQVAYLAEKEQRRAEYLSEKEQEKREDDAPKPGLLTRIKGWFR